MTSKLIFFSLIKNVTVFFITSAERKSPFDKTSSDRSPRGKTVIASGCSQLYGFTQTISSRNRTEKIGAATSKSKLNLQED